MEWKCGTVIRPAEVQFLRLLSSNRLHLFSDKFESKGFQFYYREWIGIQVILKKSARCAQAS